MIRVKDDPLTGISGALLKFLAGAVFGGFVSFVIFIILLMAPEALVTFFAGPYKHILWGIPVAWGLLSILWFDPMLDLAAKIFEAFFGLWREKGTGWDGS